jgi:hypothetical protein
MENDYRNTASNDRFRFRFYNYFTKSPPPKKTSPVTLCRGENPTANQRRNAAGQPKKSALSPASKV